MKTTRRSSYRRARLALFAGVAVLTVALAFTAALRFADDSPKETVSDAPTAARKEPKFVDAPVERAAPPTESGENVSNAERKTAGESFRYSADRWIEMIQNQLLPEQRSKKGMIERLERLRKRLEQMPPEERYAYVKSDSFYVWEWRPNLSDLENRVRKAIFEETGTYDPYPILKTPRSVIEILVEGMDDLTAARSLHDPPWEWNWTQEPAYALEYVDRALETDPTSRDALLFKRDIVGEYAAEEAIARQLIEHHPNDEKALVDAALSLRYKFPEETVIALMPYLESIKGAPNGELHDSLGVAYERLGMLEEAMEQYKIALEAGDRDAKRGYGRMKRGKPYPLIWETRAAAEAAKQSLLADPAPPSEAHEAPPNLEAEMSAAYADFAKAYESAFEMEYALSEATPEGYMNALLGMARAFARAGDAERAQNAYNAARKRYSPEEIQQVFRRFDEQDRLRREASNEEDDGEDD